MDKVTQKVGSKPVTKTRTKELDISSANQSLWLVKIPQFVAEQWTHSRNNEIIGSLKITMKPSGPNLPPTKQLAVKLINGTDAQCPDDFTFEEVAKSAANTDSFISFSSSNDTKGGFSIDGRVTKNLLLKPQGTKEYRHLIRSRGINKITSRRETHVADAVDVQRAQNQSHTVEFITSEKNELKRKNLEVRGNSSAAKAARLAGVPSSSEADMNALKTKVFEAFEMSEKLTLKDIAAYCQNVSGYKEKDLREILDEYAKYTSKGTFKTLWELKADYRDNYSKREDGGMKSEDS